MNKYEWKEARKYYTIDQIFFYWSKFKLKQSLWFFCHLWYLISKYKHHHVYNPSIRCLICRKYKRDIDYERYKKI